MLVVGGPKESLAPENSLDIEQFPFTFKGLSEAYQRLPLADVVVLIPDENIFALMPEAKHFSAFLPRGAGGLNPIFAKLGLLAPAPIGTVGIIQKQEEPGSTEEPVPVCPYEKSVLEQAEIALDLIQQSGQPGFIKRAAFAFLLEVLKLSTALVKRGVEVYMLLPRMCDESNNDLRELISKVAPGIQVGQDALWATHVKGEWDWILKDVESDLYFDLAADYYHENIEPHFADEPEMLPNPNLILKFLEPDMELHYDVGATDRFGTRRFLVFSWGKGSFILAPNECLPVIIERLSEKKAATAPSQVAPQSPSVSTPSPDPVPATGLARKKRNSWPRVVPNNQTEASKIWGGYRSTCKSSFRQPEYNDCFDMKKTNLEALGVKSGEHLKAILDTLRNVNKNVKKRAKLEEKRKGLKY